MNDDDTLSVAGPVEAFPWPEQLTARVVQAGAQPRLQGYDVQRDLAAVSWLWTCTLLFSSASRLKGAMVRSDSLARLLSEFAERRYKGCV
jgi:hypothetical protein